MVHIKQRGNSTSLDCLQLTQTQYNSLVWLRQQVHLTAKQRDEYIRLSTIQNFGYDVDIESERAMREALENGK